MIPDDKKHEKRFKCPNCQQPIVSRFTYCKQCETKFGRDTLFSCPRCGALVRQLERVCPGCQSRLTDWGVGAEWLGTPLASASQKIETPKEIEPGPIVSKPLPELKKPEQVDKIPKPAPTPTPLPELKKPDQPDQSRKLTSAPTQKPAPSKITRAEALGRTNGLKHGRVNGTKQGLVNGTKKGLVNGTSRGRVNGTNKGLVNGTRQGRVNGFKAPVASEREEESSLMRRMIGGRVPARQLVAVSFVVILLVSSAMILSLAPAAPGQSGIVIDGQFSDWASISSYQISDILPGNIPQIIEAKINTSGDKLNVYMRLQDNAFSGSTLSSYYILIDEDSNVNTGYLLAWHQLGADRMVTLTGWDGHLMETFDSDFTDSSDQGNWSAWSSLHYSSAIQSQSEIEISIPDCSGAPLVQLMTVGAGGERNSPIMSNHGTIVASQTSLLTGGLATSALQSVIRVSMRAMGVPAGNYSVIATISNATGADLASQILQVSTSSWTTADFTVNLSSLDIGESFSIKARLSSTVFVGPLDVDGEPIKGYYLSAPSGIVIDGIFGDWTSRKITDTDSLAVDNPNIDIAEYGACTQNSSHFFYVGMKGEALGGANLPEERVKPSGGGGGGPPVVRLRKTGEDMLQAFIDKNPGNGTGLTVFGGNRTIQADYLIEVFGRKGIVTTSSVEQWSSSSHKWTPLGGIGEIGIGGQGIEFSVAKSLLGNLTDSEVIFYTTDWKVRSDDCWLSNQLSDPWAMTSSGTSSLDYRSILGDTWSQIGTITCATGDRIVDISSDPNNNMEMYAVSAKGRVYTWLVGTSTAWSSNITDPVNGSYEIVAIAPYETSHGAYVMATNGQLWYCTGLDSGSGKDWIYNTAGSGKVKDGIFDFIDLSYHDVGSRYYAIRSAQNTTAYWATTSLTFTATTVTGTNNTQSHIVTIEKKGGGAPNQAKDKLYVLTEKGQMRYSSDGGATWANWGNLPWSGTGNSSKYIGMVHDVSSSYSLWVITDTGYVYKNASGSSSFTKTGRPSTANFVGIATPNIPEFDSVIFPVISIAILIILFEDRKRRKN